MTTWMGNVVCFVTGPILSAIMFALDFKFVTVKPNTIFVHNNFSSAPGDWVNCGLCGEWAHFGCDRRQGLGTFKVKTCLL